jgi:hypothetical protein
MWEGFLFAIGFMALGLYLWRLAWGYLQLRRDMRKWPRVPAQVLGYRSELRPRSRRVDVQVSYQYNGQARQVWCRSPTRSAYGRGDLQASRQVAAKFPRGTWQQVFINPATPEEVFLELPEPHMLAMLAGGGTILVAVAFALVTPDLFGVDRELVTLGFMLVLAVALSVVAVFAAIALWRLPRPRRPKQPLVRPRKPRPNVRPWRH